MAMNFELARSNMVSQQVRTWDVLDDKVLEILGELPREEFVPQRYRQLAYSDMEIPLNDTEVMMKPVVEGRFLQTLDLAGDEDVLEIGTGSGYFTACLSKLAGRVRSVEIDEKLAASARSHLSNIDLDTIEIETGDALQSWTTSEQFDVIVLTGAVESLPSRLTGWLKPGGRVIAAVGQSPNMHVVIATAQGNSLVSQKSVFETDLPYLTGGQEPASFEF